MRHWPSIQRHRRIRQSMWVRRPDFLSRQALCRHEQMEVAIGHHEYRVVCLGCMAELGGGQSQDVDAVMSEWQLDESAT